MKGCVPLKGGGWLHELRNRPERCPAPDRAMNRESDKHGFSRPLIILLSVIITAMMFLYTPLQPWSAPQTRTGGYAQYLTGSALSEQPRSADELPPDRCALSIPAIKQIPFTEQIEAENLSLQMPMKCLDTRPGFSGSGFLSFRSICG